MRRKANSAIDDCKQSITQGWEKGHLTPSSVFQDCKKFLSGIKNSLRGKYHLYTGEKVHWLEVVLRLESSVVPLIFPWVIFFTLYGFLIAFLHAQGIHIGFATNRVVTNAVLSFNIGLTLLLVFRTNTAHDRFWEGRKLWGALVNASRNLAQGISVVVPEKSAKEGLEKEAVIRLIPAFAFSLKHHLRGEHLDEEIVTLVSDLQYSKLKDVKHPPLQIAFWIRDYLQHQYKCSDLNVYQLANLQQLVDELVNISGACERILKTPVPLIYAIKLRILVGFYCLIIPLEIVSYLGWWTGLVVAFVSFTLLSIEQIGSEIEEPFGHDPNDLPLGVICNTIRRNVEEVIVVGPVNAHDWQV